MVQLEGSLHNGIPVVVIEDASACCFTEACRTVRVRNESAQCLAQRRRVSRREGDTALPKHVGALGNVTRHASAAVAHGLQQAHGHAFHIGREHVGIAIGVQLLQGLAVYEAGEEDAGVALRSLAK